MCCLGRDKERRCAHCGRVVEDPRSLLFFGSVVDFCDLECQRRFVAEYFARPSMNESGLVKRKNRCPSVTSTNFGDVTFPTR